MPLRVNASGRFLPRIAAFHEPNGLIVPPDLLRQVMIRDAPAIRWRAGSAQEYLQRSRAASLHTGIHRLVG